MNYTYIMLGVVPEGECVMWDNVVALKPGCVYKSRYPEDHFTTYIISHPGWIRILSKVEALAYGKGKEMEELK